MQIRPLELSDISAVRAFADREIGDNYYSEAELSKIYHQSISNGRQCSLLLTDGDAILGMRITYPPGKWEKGKGNGLAIEKWGVPLKDTAYFQSIFLDPSVTGKGWGRKLSLAAIEVLKSLGTKAIVTHSWKESPNKSSRRYLEGLGFAFVVEHPLYWNDVPHKCTGCGGDPRCVCTAEEMILHLR
jgi:GNAT superfamily N-acetyltransferase